MLKDYYNEIIPPWDSRYGKLGHIWKKYNFKNIFNYISQNSLYYYIPPELVIKDLITNKIDVRKVPIEWEYANLISNRFLFRIYDYINLSGQELFDIIILHNNSKLNRPRCAFCHRYLNWSYRFSHGYYGDGGWMYRKYNYCSTSCRTRMMRLDINYYSKFNESIKQNYVFMHSIYSITKSSWTHFLNKGNLNDLCHFYIAITRDNLIKFGVTAESLEVRSYMEAWKGAGFYRSIKSIFTRSRLFIGNFEALIKLSIGKEYLIQSNYSQLLSLISRYSILDLDRNYQFDQLYSIMISTTNSTSLQDGNIE